MPSTEAGLRSELVSAIQAIAVTKLGFDIAGGNVKDYLLEHEQDEKQVSYLMASVAGVKKVRVWFVWVTASDNFFALGGITQRRYEIIIAGFAEAGIAGAGAKYLIDGANSIRNAIRTSTTITINSKVNHIESNTPIDIVPYFGVDPKAGKILLGSMRYTAIKNNPDWV